MSRRNIIRKKEIDRDAWRKMLFELPLEEDGLIYVRQSSEAQKLKNIHSFEMQTEKFLEHFRSQGFTGNIRIIADDEALSGTLDIHERPGMTKMMKLIEQEAIAWIGVVHPNRLTRDPWLITPAVLMKTCHQHKVIIITLRSVFNFNDEYSRKIFMLEAEEAAKYLETMKLIMGGAKRTASDRGYYDGRWIVPGYIVDRSDPLRKKYTIYEPHAYWVRWIFRRFLELDGNFPQLCREIEKMPYLFPRFESWVEKKNITKFSLKKSITAEGDYKISQTGLMGILTNPVYIGWWIPLDGGVVEHNHPSMIDEALFTFAHKRMSSYDLNGERQKPIRISRSGGAEGLLKKLLKDSAGNSYYAKQFYGGYYISYTCRSLSRDYGLGIKIADLDAIFLPKFLERVQTIQGCDDWEDKVLKKSEEREEIERLIRKSIAEVDLRMAEIMDTVKTPGCPKSMKISLFEEYEGLEKKKKSLESQLQPNPEEQEDEEEILYQIHSLLPDLIGNWERLPYLLRVRFVNALVRCVTLDRVTPSWVKMEITWKIEGWETDVCHFLRDFANKSLWSDEENAIFREQYPFGDPGDILAALPDRSWCSILAHAKLLGVRRETKRRNSVPSNRFYFAEDDLSYAEENNISTSDKNPQWSRVVFGLMLM